MFNPKLRFRFQTFPGAVSVGMLHEYSGSDSKSLRLIGQAGNDINHCCSAVIWYPCPCQTRWRLFRASSYWWWSMSPSFVIKPCPPFEMSGLGTNVRKIVRLPNTETVAYIGEIDGRRVIHLVKPMPIDDFINLAKEFE
jgi:hypothetical protein